MQQFHHGYMGVLDTLQHHQLMMIRMFIVKLALIPTIKEWLLTRN